MESAGGPFEWATLQYLIQNRKTREYFHQGEWTLDPQSAQQYPDVSQAMIACWRHQLKDVELVLHFGLEIGRNCSLQLSLPAQPPAARISC